MMTIRSKETLAFLLIFLASACFCPRSFAFVLQGPHVLELMAEKLGQAESLYVSQKVTFYNISTPPATGETEEETGITVEDIGPPGDDPDAESLPTPAEYEPQTMIVEMEESLRYLFPEAFRSDIVTDENQRIHVYANGEALTIIGGASRATPQTRFDFYKDLLLIRSRPELVERLTQLNVDVSVSSLGRFEGRIYFVIGAQYPDESRTQIWVDQENFQPLRWIISPGAGGFQTGTLEVRYLDWWQFDENFWYPMRIEFYQDNVLVREMKVQRYEVNASISRELLNIEQLRSTYPQASPALSDTGESEPVSDVQEAIEEFSKMFE
jgi:outer membrane lipoprotein-sorting protein